MKELLEKYNFSDLDIFMATGKGKYLNIANYCVFSHMNEQITLKGVDTNARFVLSFCSYLTNKKRYICEITFQELLALAKIRDRNAFNLFASKKDEDLFALLCARRIVEYDYGKICCKDSSQKIYTFHRLVWGNTDDGRKRREYPVVLEKSFREVGEFQ